MSAATFAGYTLEDIAALATRVAAGESLTADEFAARLADMADKDVSHIGTPIWELAETYKKQLQFDGYSEDSIHNRDPVLRKLAQKFPSSQLGDLNTEHLRAFLAEAWGDKSQGTRSNRTTLLRTFFKWAYDNDYIATNPAARIKTPRMPESDRQSHELDTVKKLVRSQTSRRDQLALEVLYWLGLRRGELRVMQFRHFNYRDQTVTVYGKGSTIIDQSVPAGLCADVEVFQREHDRKPTDYLLYPTRVGRTGFYPNYEDVVIWERPGRPLSDSGVFRWWRRCLERADIAAFPMHEMRHTAGTHFYQRSKGDPLATQHFMRHKNITTTVSTYIHLDRVQEVAAVQRQMPSLWDDTDDS